MRFVLPEGAMRDRLGIILLAAAGLLLLCRVLFSGAEPEQADAFYRVYRTETGTAETVSVRDYLIGTVGAEMPASFHPEALKAQTVAAHTYAEYVTGVQGAALSDDCGRCQAYLPPEQLKERLGEAAYEKIAAAVDAAGDLLLLYDGAPALTVYHACSRGQTRSAEAVWGTAVPYLVPVGSPADGDAPQNTGHGVGMSQYGAEAMAEQGAGFAEILQHYYPGTELEPHGRGSG